MGSLAISAGGGHHPSLARLFRGRRRAGREAAAPRGGPATLLDAAFLRHLDTLALRARGARTAGLIGEHASRRTAASMEFADYRAYTPGDDVRLIDWNVYARLGELCRPCSK